MLTRSMNYLSVIENPSALKGIIPLNAANFALFALRPNSKLLNKQERTTALALSILLGFLTVGFTHLICKIICEVRKHQLNSLLNKAISVLQKFGGGTDEVYQGFHKLDTLALERIQLRLGNLTEHQAASMGSQLMPLLPTSQYQLYNLLIAGLEKIDNVVS